MPPRRAASTKTAPKRDRSSSLSDDSEPKSKPEPKKRAAPKAKATATATAKPKATKAPKFPPPGLDAASHPARSGLPAFQFTETKENGAIGPRDPSLPLFVGAHVSMAGGPATALLRASKAGANGLALFVKSQRKWVSKDYEPEMIEQWKELTKSKADGGMGYKPESILVHGGYLINLSNNDETKWNQSYECFRDDIHRCHQLGIKLYNWHPGSTLGNISKEEGYKLVAKGINKVHKDVPEVITVIENMANAGSNILGTAFADLKGMIDLVEDKSRVRVCLDTCHTFAAGYDLRTPEAYAATMKEFDEVVGNKYLGGIHLNDSKTDLGSNKDLHENIGLGQIGLDGFRQLMRDPLMVGIPIVLETPSGPAGAVENGDLEIWAKEIKLLYEIQAIPDDEWESKKVDIEARWRKERDAISPPKETAKKAAPAKKAAAAGRKAPAQKKGSKKKVVESESEMSDGDSE